MVAAAEMHNLTPHELILVAAKSGRDPRTVQRFVEGERPVSSTSAHVIAAALRELGYDVDALRGGAPTPLVRRRTRRDATPERA